MFTGLIEEIGIVRYLQRLDGALSLTIAGEEVMQDLAVDDSIAINGVCLTAIKISGATFEVAAVEETLRKTTLGSMQVGSRLNLERSLKFSDRMGGHFVQGHVDGVGHVSNRQRQNGGILFSVKLPERLMKYVISEGSIAINGVSLTVARLDSNEVTISLIPHTLEKTTLNDLKVGDGVNIEVDLLGKYIENLLKKSDNGKITEAWLQKMGYE